MRTCIGESIDEASDRRGDDRPVTVVGLLALVLVATRTSEERPAPRTLPCEGLSTRSEADFAAPAGTTFCVKGTVTISATVTMEDGDHIVGGALVGSGFSGNMLRAATGATVRVTGTDLSGARGTATCAPDCGRAIKADGAEWVLTEVTCHDNANQCIGGGGARIVMAGSECYANGFDAPFLGADVRSSACIKQASADGGDILVARSHIHDNAWIGVWCDFCGDGPFVLERSTIERNGRAGISYEVSGGHGTDDRGHIHGNRIADNGGGGNLGGLSAGEPTAITCNSCANLLIEGNTFGGNQNVLLLVNSRRGSWGDIQGVVVRDNVLNGDRLDCSAWISCDGNE